MVLSIPLQKKLDWYRRKKERKNWKDLQIKPLDITFGEIFESFMFPRLLCEATGRPGVLCCLKSHVWGPCDERGGHGTHRSAWATSQTGAI